MAFKKGHKLAKGGAREGAGRPSNWLKAKCTKIIKNKKLIEFLGDVASGKPFIHKVALVAGTKEVFQKTIDSADVKDRLKALEMLLDRGFGKAAQAISNPDGSAVEGMVIIRA